MKISKNKVSAQPVSANDTIVSNNYSEAIDYIKSAIESLGDLAMNGDELAKEAIANLGVVLLELK